MRSLHPCRKNRFLADMIYDQRDRLPDHPILVDPEDPTRRRAIEPDAHGLELLEPIYRQGKRALPPARP